MQLPIGHPGDKILTPFYVSHVKCQSPFVFQVACLRSYWKQESRGACSTGKYLSCSSKLPCHTITVNTYSAVWKEGIWKTAHRCDNRGDDRSFSPSASPATTCPRHLHSVSQMSRNRTWNIKMASDPPVKWRGGRKQLLRCCPLRWSKHHAVLLSWTHTIPDDS